jgi:hypothetical protein
MEWTTLRRLLIGVGFVLTLGLYVASARFMIWAAGYYWAAGGPPNPNPQPYVARGNACIGIAAILFAAATTTLVITIRHYRRSKTTTRVNSP